MVPQIQEMDLAPPANLENRKKVETKIISFCSPLLFLQIRALF